MAYEYDQLGNIIGEYESEEERRLREAANQPVKQTTVYNPDGTSEVTIKGTPEALSSANPNTPTLTSPVSPDEVYKRMLQAESGNRDYTKSGQPVTSPKGAMFASQVMPATAANPGYGVRPAQSQTPEEYNRVGREYYQALLKQFGGDTQKAAAAYNAGPGRVQQNIRQNQGQMNVGQLPQETQGYLQKIGQGISNMIPSAQASTLPQANVPAPQATMPQANVPAPQATFQGQTDEFGGMEERSKYALGTGQGNQGIQQQPIGQAPTAGPVFDFYQQFQDNPRALISMAFTNQDVGVPDWMRDRMKNRASELITQQRELENAKQQIPTMSENDIAKMLREKTTGGSYLKAAFFGLIGMENSAMAEAAKLGVGKETMTQINGQPAMVKIAANGTPIDGYNAVTGKKLSAEELVIATQFGTTQKGTEVEAGTYMDPSGKVAGNWVLERRAGNNQYRQVGSNKIATTEEANSLRKTGVGGTLGDQRAKMIQEINLKLQGKTQEEAMAILRPYNQALAGAGQPIIGANELNISAPQIGGATAGTVGTPPAGQGATAPPPAQAGPVSPATVAAAGQRPTMNQLEADKAKTKEAAQEEGVDLGKIKVNQGKAESNADYLLTKIDQLVGNPSKDIKQHPGFETTVGAQGASYLFGLRDKPVAPQFGGGDARDFQNRMREITGQSFLQAIETLRGLGALSNTEGETATRAIQRMGYMDKDGNLVITATEKEFKEAARDFQEVIQRGVDRNRVKLGQKPKYGTPEASEQTKPAETKTGKLTAEDREAIEWIRKNPNDPRTPEIKKRLGL